jgi:quercetin dioxygenase-like cupin family protein
MKSFATALIFSAMLGPAFAQDAPSDHTMLEKNMRWEPLDGGFEISILYTNPATQATYLIIRGPANAHVPRHWHTSNETITVLKGTFVVGHDGSEDKVALTPGSFSFMPARMVHEAWTKDEGATYFITVDGKWDVNFVK